MLDSTRLGSTRTALTSLSLVVATRARGVRSRRDSRREARHSRIILIIEPPRRTAERELVDDLLEPRDQVLERAALERAAREQLGDLVDQRELGVELVRLLVQHEHDLATERRGRDTTTRGLFGFVCRARPEGGGSDVAARNGSMSRRRRLPHRKYKYCGVRD